MMGDRVYFINHTSQPFVHGGNTLAWADLLVWVNHWNGSRYMNALQKGHNTTSVAWKIQFSKYCLLIRAGIWRRQDEMCRDDIDFEEMNSSISFTLIFPLLDTLWWFGMDLACGKMPKKSIGNLHWSQIWLHRFWKHASYNTVCWGYSHIDLMGDNG